MLRCFVSERVGVHIFKISLVCRGVSMRAWIYDRLFHNLSSTWYQHVIDQLPRGAKVLDVGVGTGSSLLSQYERLKERDLKWTGIDINATYLRACQLGIDQIGADDHIDVREQSIYDLAETELLDAIYFSASFMLLPNQSQALLTSLESLKTEGVICFTQTFETKRAPLMEFIKPLLSKVTTVDFGVVTYQEAFLALLASCGLSPVYNEVMSTQGPREMRIIIAKRTEMV